MTTSAHKRSRLFKFLEKKFKDCINPQRAKMQISVLHKETEYTIIIAHIKCKIRPRLTPIYWQYFNKNSIMRSKFAFGFLWIFGFLLGRCNPIIIANALSQLTFRILLKSFCMKVRSLHIQTHTCIHPHEYI